MLAGLALLVWRSSTRHGSPDELLVTEIHRSRISPLALAPRRTAAALTVHFGTLSGVTFALMGWLPDILHSSAGTSRAGAQLLFAVTMVVGIPVSLAAPIVARRRADQVGPAVVLAAAMAGGVAGLLIAPATAPLLWAVLLGVGAGAVALALTMITTRAGGHADVGAALSSLVQGPGYAIAGVVTLLVGIVHSITDGWQWPLTAVLAVLAVQAATGLLAGGSVTVTAARPTSSRG